MNGFLAVAAGGAIGASLRHGVGLMAVRHLPSGWPHGTFAVNLLGSLLMGLLVGWLALKAEGLHQTTRLFLATGLLGGFTTFSAFSLEAVTLLERGLLGQAAAYVLLSVGASMGALFLGAMLARGLWA